MCYGLAVRSKSFLVWVVAFILGLHAVTFVFHGIGYTSDARGYIDGISRFASGQVSYFPPGYSLLLAP